MLSAQAHASAGKVWLERHVTGVRISHLVSLQMVAGKESLCVAYYTEICRLVEGVKQKVVMYTEKEYHPEWEISLAMQVFLSTNLESSVASYGTSPWSYLVVGFCFGVIHLPVTC